MTEPWFDPHQFAWIPGTIIGVVGGTLGTLVGFLAPRGKARGFVKGFFVTMILISLMLLFAGGYAWFAGQPYGVWYGLGLAGLLGTIVFPSVLPGILAQYRLSEERAMRAKDLE